MATYDSGWNRFNSPPISSGILAARAHEILEKFQTRGIRIPPSNRLSRACRLTEETNEHPERLKEGDEAFRARVQEAFRTLWEAFLVVHALYARPQAARAITNDALTCFLRGADTLEDERDSSARNTQFELYVSALFGLGGADIRKAEPDLQFDYHSERWGVAIKRVRSLNEGTLRDAMRDAAFQLRAATGRGLIALNLDSWISTLKTDGEVGELGADFARQIGRAHALIHNMSDKDALRGALFIGTWVHWDMVSEVPKLGFHVPRQIIVFTVSSTEVEKAREYFDGLNSRIENGLREVISLVSRPAV